MKYKVEFYPVNENNEVELPPNCHPLMIVQMPAGKVTKDAAEFKLVREVQCLVPVNEKDIKICPKCLQPTKVDLTEIGYKCSNCYHTWYEPIEIRC